MNLIHEEDKPVVIKGLTKQYGDNFVLENLSLEVNRGEIFGILGRNGVGKTTFLESIVGLRTPDHGTVKILGLDAIVHRKELASRIGVQPQEASLLQRQTVREIMMLFDSFYAVETDIDKILYDFNMEELLAKRVKDLSVGQRQRLLVAVSLIGDPEVLIFDEPTAGLDPQIRLLIWENLRKLQEQSKTILITTHYMEEAHQLCNRIAILHDRKFIVCDEPNKVIQMHATQNNRTLEGAFVNLTGNMLRRGVD